MKKYLPVIFFFVTVMVLFVGCGKADAEKTVVYFFDNATFGEFTDEKLEEFIISEDTTVRFILRGEMKSGEFHLKIYNKNQGEIIYETTDLRYDSEFYMELKAGTYCYLLDIKKCTTGFVYNKAELKWEK